ncbi:hypothetical protein A2239_04425 [Candidatus Uhrbacteria bacterium RIFOXYA2_FULL_40_9]|nr:MAG: hypothetical protein A2239_04425 [Candidatus Uhrbacteria bacterium RIFOXYA2_FULL_40_9]OGL97328.1 MAG: hypothetical protein A2332_03645 [Candidatus Uhrbacteria bacterium RIFOXYB2_FULL_41_18]HCB56134.1 hypothetical protein [Candidatus Uhrbacteria bacterium]
MPETKRPFLGRSFRHPIETPEERVALESQLIQEIRIFYENMPVKRFSEAIREVLQSNGIETQSTNPRVYSDQARERWTHYYEFLLKTPQLEEIRQESQHLLKERIAKREQLEQQARLKGTPAQEKTLRERQIREAKLLALQDQRRSGRDDKEDIP